MYVCFPMKGLGKMHCEDSTPQTGHASLQCTVFRQKKSEQQKAKQRIKRHVTRHITFVSKPVANNYS